MISNVKEIKTGLQVDAEGSNHDLNVDVNNGGITSGCISVDACDSLFQVVIAHDSFVLGMEFVTFQEWQWSLDSGFNVDFVSIRSVSSHTKFDVVTCFSDDEAWDVRISPVISSLVEQVFKFKVKGEHPIEEVSNVSICWVVAGGDAAIARAQEGVVVVWHLGDGVCRIESAKTEL